MGVKSFDKSYLGKNNSVRVHTRRGDVCFEMHGHEYFEMIYYSGCVGVMHINGNECAVTDSCIFLLTPTDFHEIFAKESESSRSVVLSISETVIDESLFKGGAIQPCVIYNPDGFLTAAFDKLYEIYREGGSEGELLHLVNYAISAVSRNGTPINPDSSYIHPKIREAVTYVMAHIDGDSSLPSIAKRVGLSPTYFSTKFREVMKRPYQAWLAETKIARARRMLESTDEPVLNIAYECGYNNPSHFIKIFGRTTGQTPREYRKNFKK